MLFSLTLLFLFSHCPFSLSLDQNVSSIRKRFKTGTRLLGELLTNGASKGSGLRWLEPLVDDFGHRHLCSRQLEDAIDFTVERLRSDGFHNVHTETVRDLPKWVRGADTAFMLAPRRLKLNILAVMGGAPRRVVAPAVVMSDLDELQSVNVTGKIVVFAEKWTGYGSTVKFRTSAARRVEQRGGVGVLVKSIAPFSLSTAHTGMGSEGTSIPAACIALEEAELLERLYRRGKEITLEIDVKSAHAGKCTSRNTIFEIKGSQLPNEIVMLSAHMDTWDVGQGALDDGGGMAAMWQAMDTIRALSRLDPVFLPKRTIRAIFWTAEEQGLLGAQAYFEAHKDSDERFVFVSETDQGAFRPRTYKSMLKFAGSERQMGKVKQVVQLMNLLGIPLSVVPRKDQGDVTFWSDLGVPSVNYCAEKGFDFYFQFHHSSADYLNIFEEDDIDYTAAIFGTLAYTIANMDDWP